jgi:amino acid adenylation domain-containing protein
MTDVLVPNLGSADDRSYWLRLMPQDAGEATLPLDRPRPPVNRPRQATITVVFPDALCADLTRLTKGLPFLLYTVVLAGVKICLRRYGAGAVVVTGSPARQTHDGSTVATAVPIALEFDGAMRFRDMIGALRDRLNETYGHQIFNCWRLIEHLGRGTIVNRSPLFDVAVIFPDIHGPLADLGNDLTITLTAQAGGIVVEISYNDRLFDKATVERFVGHLLSVLTAALANPAMPVDMLPLITEAERAEITVWNNTHQQGLRTDLISLFESQIARSPQALAVEFEHDTRTYEMLNCRANRIARWLRARGIGPEQPVGLFAERSIALVEAVLGIIKAGPFVLPLDPSYPRERLGFMLRDGRVPLLLTQRHLAGLLPAEESKLVFLDDLDAELTGFADDNPAPVAGPDHLAYLLYTSGSTGWPKGVAMTRRAISNLIAWQIAGWRAERERRTLQFASLNFDVSFQELFATLCSGGLLVMLRDALRRERTAFTRFVAERKIARLFLPVVALKELAKGVEETGVVPLGLREIITAGEQLQLNEAIVGMIRKIDGCVLHNHYGPTESHVVTTATMAGTPSRWSPLPPIGRPLSNCRIHILDRHLEPVPIGVVGEIFIAGDCLARGYWRRPGATAERFLPDPFAHASGGRMYRTGDLGRRSADGNIEFLGRIDHQVKIRGYRVELGEIEVALGQHPTVRSAVVTSSSNAAAKPAQLIAYVVPALGAQFDPAELRHFLQARLPNFMIPSLYVAIDALPLTPTGKVDRRALPSPNSSQPYVGTDYVEPRDSTERQLAAIWTEVLKLNRIGIHDNFFALGGHSLLVAQVIARVRHAFNYDMPAHVMFDAPTVAEMASRLRAVDGSDDEIDRLAAELENLTTEQREALLQGHAV